MSAIRNCYGKYGFDSLTHADSNRYSVGPGVAAVGLDCFATCSVGHVLGMPLLRWRDEASNIALRKIATLRSSKVDMLLDIVFSGSG